MDQELKHMYLPALKGRVGSWVFYTTIMKFSEVTERVQLSSEIYKNKRLSDMVQRYVRSERTRTIASYLKHETERFFPAMVVAVFEGQPNWLDISIETRNTHLNLDLSALDRSKLDSFGFVSLTGKEKLFPLDGQHRLAGIREALREPNQEDEYLADDEVTVMLVAHEPTEKGRTRSRRLFTVLNKRAVPVKTHEIIALDEDDIMAISTRYLVEEFEPLTGRGIVGIRTNANIPPNNTTEFTTIVTLYHILFDVFRAIPHKAIPDRTQRDLKFRRPDDRWLDFYISCAKNFFLLMMTTFPEVNDCLTCSNASRIIAQYRSPNGGHILFRPLGQRLLAKLVSISTKSCLRTMRYRSISASDLEASVIEALQRAFNIFGDLPTSLSQKPYSELIWEPQTGKMRVRRASILRNLILKRYGLITRPEDKKLEQTLRSNVGESWSIEDFIGKSWGTI